ncbi:MAG: helix-turn-helix domain-containing protein [Glaciimonas sp.]|nr:helix-turn-helix domain-containing protein [Glaciimonas sp.]
MSQLSSNTNLHAIAQAATFVELQSGDQDSDIAHLVAVNLARLRSLRHLSLDALARISGVSRAMLAQIESGRSVPSIRVLCRIASALQVSVPAFLRDFAMNGMELLPAHASKRLVSANGRFSSRSLLPAQRQQRVEFHEIRLQPGSIECLNSLLPGTFRNLVVSQGMLEVRANEQTQLLGPGDAIFFDADQAHSYRNPGDTEGLAYVVTHHPEA